MKYLYSWLKEYYPEIPAIDDLVPLLIGLGHDVEAVESCRLEGIVVAVVDRVEPHPSASKLKIVTVSTATETHAVVCGAPNVSVGQKVAYAPVGVTLPTGLTLQAASIRGITSQGMLCAGDELGLNDDHSALYPLPLKAEVGAPVARYTVADAVITCDITSDRGDVLSHFGLARDVCAKQEKRLLHYAFKSPIKRTLPAKIKIGSIHPDCRQIDFFRAESAKAITTPRLWQARLTAIGWRTINFPTDLTNYAMAAFGQPLHAYDAARMIGSTMSVRRAHDGEPFETINATRHALSVQNLVIACDDTPVAIAGVTGGAATKTTNRTTEVIFEAALFDPKAISVSARGLSELTEAALRFERDRDATLSRRVLDHIAWWWTELTGGQISQTVSSPQYTPAVTKIVTQPKALTAILGAHVEDTTMADILRAIGCQIEPTADEWAILAPPWRHDLSIVEDIVEEIVRYWGVDNLPRHPLAPSVPQWRRSSYWRLEHLKDNLAALGMSEVETYPFVTASDCRTLAIDSSTLTRLARPMAGETTYLRPSLLAGLLKVVASNPETPHIALFELARVFGQNGEHDRLAIVVASVNSSWGDSLWLNTFERLKLPVSSWMSRVKPIENSVLRGYKIRKPHVTWLEVAPDDLIASKSFEVQQVDIPDLDSYSVTNRSRYQESRRDIAVVVPQEVDANNLAADIVRWGKQHNIIHAAVFDDYAGKGIKEGHHSVGIHVFYQASDRTLNQEEISTLHRRLEDYLKQTYDATIR